MSLRLDSKPKSNKFDTVELIPSANNYGKPSQRKKRDKKMMPSFTENPEAEKAASGDEPELDEAGGGGTGRADLTSAFSNSTAHGDTPVDANEEEPRDDELDEEEQGHHTAPKKFGTLDGVFGRCLLCMWGVIMFLRTGWIVGNAGVWQSTLVMVLSASITLFTTLSLSAICTNGEISHGGPYFLISRSLGPNLGGVIGLLFAVGNCVGVSLHLVGFAEAIYSIYYPNSIMANLDIQLYAEIGLIFLMLIALRGVGSIIKFNLFLLFLMFVSIIAFFVGTFINNSAKEKVGYTGYSGKTFAANWGPAYLDGYNFLTMVAIFFPSVTGCMAGANISGDLKNPAVNIPVGTIWAVIFSMIVYLMIAWMLGACVERQVLDDNGVPIDGAGLYYNYIIMSDISLWRPLVDMGIYASTFSSATSCFVAAPRIFKAVCDDGLFPIFSFFAVGRKSDGEPVRCYVLVLVICFLINISGNINFIAPLVTNFFLVTYALVNYSVFAWDISKSPGWRPSFKYYHPYISLFATFQSVVLMFLIDWIMGLITAIIGFACYKYIESRDVEVNWGTTVESKLYLNGCKIALKYQSMNTEHAKIARPTFLIMLYNDNQDDVVTLFDLANYINYSQGLIMIGHVLVGDLHDEAVQKEYVLKRKSYREYSLSHEILKKCIMECCIAKNYQEGTQSVIQMAGMGGMQPNVFMIKIDEVDMKLNAGNLAYDKKTPLWFTNLSSALLSGLGIIMVPNNFSLEQIVDLSQEANRSAMSLSSRRTFSVAENESGEEKTIDVWWLFDDGGLTILTAYLLTKNKYFKNYKLRIMALDEIGFEDHTEMVALIAKLRINADIQPVKSAGDAHSGQDSLADFLVDVADDADEANTQSTKVAETGQTLTEGGDDEGAGNSNQEEMENGAVAADEQEEVEMKHANEEQDEQVDDARRRRKVSQFAKEKILKYRHVGQTIEKHSKDAQMCFITMPYPRVKFAWYEYSQIIHDLTPKDIPTVFVRGTQEQVLTFSF